MTLKPLIRFVKCVSTSYRSGAEHEFAKHIICKGSLFSYLLNLQILTGDIQQDVHFWQLIYLDI